MACRLSKRRSSLPAQGAYLCGTVSCRGVFFGGARLDCRGGERDRSSFGGVIRTRPRPDDSPDLSKVLQTVRRYVHDCETKLTSAVQRPPQLGDSAGPLQENGTSRSRPQPSQRNGANPPASQPHRSKLMNASSTNRGSPAPLRIVAASARNVSMWSRTLGRAPSAQRPAVRTRPRGERPSPPAAQDEVHCDDGGNAGRFTRGRNDVAKTPIPCPADDGRFCIS